MPFCLPPLLPGLLLLAYGGIGVPLHLLEPPQIVLDGLVLLILGLVLLLKSRLFLFPRMDGDFTRRGTALVKLAAGHVERPQLALMLPLEFFPFPFPLDTLQLVIDGLGVPVEVNKAKQFLQFVQTVMRRELMNHQKDILIIKDFSRFSRRNGRGLVELEDLRDGGVRIISIGEKCGFS